MPVQRQLFHEDEAEECSDYDDEDEYDSMEDDSDEEDPDWDPIWEVNEDRRMELRRWQAEHLHQLQPLFSLLMDTGEGMYGQSWLNNLSFDIFASFCFKYTVPGANRN